MANQANTNTNYYKIAVVPDEDTWVDDFAHWVDAHMPIYYLEDLHGSNTSGGLWVEYEWGYAAGIYTKRELITIKDIIYEWLRANGLHLSNYYVSEALARLKTKRYISVNEFDIFEPLNPFVNCLPRVDVP